jgi:hypothetical protein
MTYSIYWITTDNEWEFYHDFTTLESAKAMFDDYDLDDDEGLSGLALVNDDTEEVIETKER